MFWWSNVLPNNFSSSWFFCNVFFFFCFCFYLFISHTFASLTCTVLNLLLLKSNEHDTWIHFLNVRCCVYIYTITYTFTLRHVYRSKVKENEKYSLRVRAISCLLYFNATTCEFDKKLKNLKIFRKFYFILK